MVTEVETNDGSAEELTRISFLVCRGVGTEFNNDFLESSPILMGIDAESDIDDIDATSESNMVATNLSQRWSISDSDGGKLLFVKFVGFIAIAKPPEVFS